MKLTMDIMREKGREKKCFEWKKEENGGRENREEEIECGRTNRQMRVHMSLRGRRHCLVCTVRVSLEGKGG